LPLLSTGGRYAISSCFDTGLDVYCYWYHASDVIVTDTY